MMKGDGRLKEWEKEKWNNKYKEKQFTLFFQFVVVVIRSIRLIYGIRHHISNGSSKITLFIVVAVAVAVAITVSFFWFFFRVFNASICTWFTWCELKMEWDSMCNNIFLSFFRTFCCCCFFFSYKQSSFASAPLPRFFCCHHSLALLCPFSFLANFFFIFPIPIHRYILLWTHLGSLLQASG